MDETSVSGATPHPNPLPKEEGATATSPSPLGRGARGSAGEGLSRYVVRLLVFCLTAFFVLTAPAFAAEGVGGEVDPLVYRLAVFALAIFVGYYVVWSVTPALHTPLMSVTNAISSVIVVGALLAVGVPLIASGSAAAKFFGVLAVALASVNIFGGFLVTQRMLAMYKKKEK